MVAAALQAGDGRWLMHRRPPGKHHGGLWEFPGGKVDRAETPRGALARELREELAIGIDPATIVPAAFADGAQTAAGEHIVILLYTLHAWAGTPRPCDTGAQVAWFTAREIVRLPRPPLDIALCDALFARG